MLGRPVLGRVETVLSFTRSDPLRFCKKTYTPSNLIVVSAGNVEGQKIVDLVRERFSSLEAPTDGIANVPPKVSPTIQLQEKDLELAHLVVGSASSTPTEDSSRAARALR